MRKHLRQVLKNEFVLLTLFLLKQWLTLVHIDHRYNVYSKNFYIRPNDTDFLHKYDSYANSTRAAYRSMQQWLKLHNKKAAINSSSHALLFNRQNASRLCVGVLSKRRLLSDRFNYPFQTVVALLVRIRLRFQDEVRIDVLNVDNSAKFRPDLIDLHGLVNIVELRQDVNSKVDQQRIPKLKEEADYTSAMDYYSGQRCKHVLLLEDDSLPAPDWYEKLRHALDELVPNENTWFCLKLFTSFRPLDWLIHPPTVLISLLVALALTFLFVRLFYFILYLKYRFILGINRPQLHRSKLVVLIITVNSILIVALFNSQHVSPLGYGVSSFAIGFNTVANVFPQSKLAAISTHLESAIDGYVAGSLEFEPKDLALNRFRTKTRLKELILEPAIFQHIGLQSSLATGSINLNSISSVQYRPFQSYSFEKEFSTIEIRFDPSYWIS